MSGDINVQTFSGKVNINNNLKVGSGHLFVDTLNNQVGLNTNDPQANLHVNGNTYVHTNFRVGSGIVMNDTTGQITAGSFVGDGSALDGINSDSGSWVNGTSSNVHLATLTDNVGIGTVNPTSKLHIVDDNANTKFTIRGGGTTVNDSNVNIELFETASDFYGATIQYCGTLANQGLRFGHHVNTATPRFDMAIDRGTGKVGIGTTNPVYHLHLHNDDEYVYYRLSTTAGGVTDNFDIAQWNSTRSNGDHGVMFINRANTDMRFITNNVERLRIKNDGNVGIGTTDTHNARLCVNGQIGTYMSGNTVSNRFYVYNRSYASPVVNQIHLSLQNNNESHPTLTQADRKSGFWFGQYNDQNYTDGEQFIGFTHAIRFIKCDPDDYAGPIYYDSNTFNAKISGNLQSRIGSINSSSTSNPINFTGQHRCVVENFNTNLEGLIVSSNKNEYCSMSNGLNHGLRAITINESLPIVTLSQRCMDKSCFGVISLSEDPENETRQDRFGCFVAEFEKEEGDERVYINSVGEGAIWVTNINGPLESGDYITTSTIPGYGQGQNDDILHNYTVAKITMDCNFQPHLQNVKKIKKVLTEEKLWYKIENTKIDYQEYLTISDDKKYTHVEDGETKYIKVIKRYSKDEREEYDFEEVIDIMKNVLNEHGQIQWEDTDETEKAYKIRFLLPNGTQISEEEYTTRALADERVFIAAFVGCTYHCG